VIGTPGEEDGGGKVVLLEGGVFKGVHAAMMIHPSPVDVLQPSIIALQTFDAYFEGKEAHASGAPELGVNAADALTIAQVAIGLLRQHIHPTDRIHGIVTKGGDAPNVIPAKTSAKYIVRSQTAEDAKELRKKVERCFEAGALATGAKLKIVQTEKPYAEMKHNLDILKKFKENAESLGRIFLDDLDEKKSFSYPFKMKFFMYLLKKIGLSPKDVRSLINRFSGSTDMGNVSLVVPSIHPYIGIDAPNAVNHQPEFAAFCASPSADKAIMDGALAMAWTAVDIANDKALRQKLIQYPKK
jgi:amidohydrolase